MTTALGTPYLPSWAGRPPHMSPEDYQIWQRWRPSLWGHVGTLYFDVAVGSVAPPSEMYDEKLRAGWVRLNQRRIDVVADRGETAEIIELRFDATPNAVGRLLMYAQLWHEDNPLQIPTTLTLVTNFERPDMRALCRAHSIDYHVV